MPARFHALVQHADDLYNAWLERTIEDHMYRVSDGRLVALFPTVADVEAPNSRQQFGAVLC